MDKKSCAQRLEEGLEVLKSLVTPGVFDAIVVIRVSENWYQKFLHEVYSRERFTANPELSEGEPSICSVGLVHGVFVIRRISDQVEDFKFSAN